MGTMSITTKRELEHPDLHIHMDTDMAFECLEHYLSHKLSYREGEKERAFAKIVLAALKNRVSELEPPTPPTLEQRVADLERRVTALEGD